MREYANYKISLLDFLFVLRVVFVVCPLIFTKFQCFFFFFFFICHRLLFFFFLRCLFSASSIMFILSYVFATEMISSVVCRAFTLPLVFLRVVHQTGTGQFWLRLQITTMHHSGVLAEANGLFGNGFYYNNNMIFAIVCVTCWIGSALVEMYLDFFVCLYHASVLWTSSADFTHTHKPWKKEHTKIRKNRKKYTVLMWTTTYIDI